MVRVFGMYRGILGVAEVSRSESKRAKREKAQPGIRANGRKRPWLILNVRQRASASPMDTSTIVILLCVYLLLAGIPSALAFEVLSRIPKANRKQVPALAFLLLIPFFSLVWVFYVHPQGRGITQKLPYFRRQSFRRRLRSIGRPVALHLYGLFTHPPSGCLCSCSCAGVADRVLYPGIFPERNYPGRSLTNPRAMPLQRHGSS